MTDWLANDRDNFLDELIWHEGLGTRENPGLCDDCKEDLGVYRCMECTGKSLCCKLCLVKDHRGLPLHRIEVSFLLINLLLSS